MDTSSGKRRKGILKLFYKKVIFFESQSGTRRGFSP